MLTFEELEDEDSDPEDIEYRPSSEEDSSEDDEIEDDNQVDDDCINDKKISQKSATKTKIKTKKVTLPNKRRGKNSSDSKETENEPQTINDSGTTALNSTIQDSSLDDISLKQRSEDLWASFLSDVEPPISKQSAILSDRKDSSAILPNAAHRHPVKPKVTVTKVYDFAGESVTVTEEVDADSKKARDPSAQVIPCNAAVSNSSLSNVPATAAKRSGVTALLSKLGPKPKMSVLEKSRLDWDNFTKTTGMVEDLKSHNRGRGGYLQRQAFLNRVDAHQFEQEREMRAKHRK